MKSILLWTISEWFQDILRKVGWNLPEQLELLLTLNWQGGGGARVKNVICNSVWCRHYIFPCHERECKNAFFAFSPYYKTRIELYNVITDPQVPHRQQQPQRNPFKIVLLTTVLIALKRFYICNLPTKTRIKINFANSPFW